MKATSQRRSHNGVYHHLRPLYQMFRQAIQPMTIVTGTLGVAAGHLETNRRPLDRTSGERIIQIQNEIAGADDRGADHRVRGRESESGTIGTETEIEKRGNEKKKGEGLGAVHQGLLQAAIDTSTRRAKRKSVMIAGTKLTLKKRKRMNEAQFFLSPT